MPDLFDGPQPHPKSPGLINRTPPYSSLCIHTHKMPGQLIQQFSIPFLFQLCQLNKSSFLNIYFHIFLSQRINSIKIHPSIPLSTRSSMQNQHRVNRRRRRNLPAELKVEIVDCFPVENAVHFLANVPSRLIIHHCAPRLRRILKMACMAELKMEIVKKISPIPQITTDYGRTLPAPNSHGQIRLMNGHKYTWEMDIFLRHGAAHCDWFAIWRGTSDGFVGYPANFFDELIKHYYQTKVPIKAVRNVGINLPLTNPAPWPTALVQPQAGEMNVEEVEVHSAEGCVLYILHNKHNPVIAFKLWIFFRGDAKCYQQMTAFVMWRVEDVC